MHFAYVMFEIEDYKNTKLKDEICLNLNLYKKIIQNDVFILMGFRKPPNLVFLPSLKKLQAKQFKEEYLKDKITEFEQNIQQEIGYENYTLLTEVEKQEYIQNIKNKFENQIKLNFENLVSNEFKLRKRERQMKTDLKEYKKKTGVDLDKKVISKKQKKQKRRLKAEKEVRIWNKILKNNH